MLRFPGARFRARHRWPPSPGSDGAAPAPSRRWDRWSIPCAAPGGWPVSAVLPRRAAATDPGPGCRRADACTTTARSRTSSPPASSTPIRALGYVTARDRLFQLDLQARAGGGTADRDAGPGRALARPRGAGSSGMAAPPSGYWRRLPRQRREPAVARRIRRRASTPTSTRCPPASCRSSTGCSARRPARWSPIRTLQVLLRMNYTLVAERRRVAVSPRRGRASATAAADALFPLTRRSRSRSSRRRASRAALRGVGAAAGRAGQRRAARRWPPARPARRSSAPAAIRRPGLGSNNWAVAPRTHARPARRCWRAIRISTSRCRRSGTRRISSCRASWTSTA